MKCADAWRGTPTERTLLDRIATLRKQMGSSGDESVAAPAVANGSVAGAQDQEDDDEEEEANKAKQQQQEAQLHSGQARSSGKPFALGSVRAQLDVVEEQLSTVREQLPVRSSVGSGTSHEPCITHSEAPA